MYPKMRLKRSVAALASAGAVAVAATAVAVNAPAHAAPERATETVDNATFTWGMSGYAQQGIFGPWRFTKPTGDAKLLKGSVSGGDQNEYKVKPVPATSMPASNPQKTPNAVKFTGGDGTVDRKTGAANFDWKGSYTVNAYPQAYNAPDEIFRDPQLRVKPDGSGVLTANFSLGAGETMTGDPVKPRDFGRLTIIAFDPGSLSANSGQGYRITPDYQRVTFDPSSDSSPQDRSCTTQDGATGWWGAWPTGFLKSLDSDDSGRSVLAHFYSTGCGGKQDYKPALPVDVTFVAK